MEAESVNAGIAKTERVCYSVNALKACICIVTQVCRNKAMMERHYLRGETWNRVRSPASRSL